MKIVRVRFDDGRHLTLPNERVEVIHDRNSGRGTAREAGISPKVEMVPTSSLHLDPKRFQYKLNTNGEGVTDLLKGKRWNEDLAGVLGVWHDPADDKLYVVNGHHRADLAISQNSREHNVPEVAVKHIQAPDAETARSIGALQNIAEGRGTPLDAAKYFRDSGIGPDELSAKGISMREATAENGLALSRLMPSLFDDVVSGKLAQNRGIAIANAAPLPEQQEAIMKMISSSEARGRTVTNAAIEEFGRMARNAGVHRETTHDLFGSHERTRSLVFEKAEVSAYVRKKIADERKLFLHVADKGRAEALDKAGNKITTSRNAKVAERAAQDEKLYDRLAGRSGPIDDILKKAAQQLAGKSDDAAIKRDAYTQIRKSLDSLRGPEGEHAGGVQEIAGSATGREHGPGDGREFEPVAGGEPRNGVALPGFEEAIDEQREAAATERGNQFSAELTRPKGDIEKVAGEMERNSPLFEGSEANPQGGLEFRHGGLGAAIPGPVLDYLKEQAELVKVSREIHGGLQDLDPQYDADVLRAVALMESLPGKPADQARAYHALENPKEPTTPVQRQIMAILGPMRAESESLFRKLYPKRAISGDYVHRIAQQKGGLLDRILKGSQSTGRGNVLKKNAAAGQKRSMMAIESPTGGIADRQVVSVGRGRVTAWDKNVPSDIGSLRPGLTTANAELDKQLDPLEREEAKLKQEQRTLNATPSRQAAARIRLRNIDKRLKDIDTEKTLIENQHLLSNLPNQMWKDKNGRLWQFKQATTKEIERETPIEYYKNAAASTVTNWLELRKAARASDYLEKIKAGPGFSSIGVKPTDPGQIPDGWQSTQLPQLMGYYFEPHVAEVFDRYAKELSAGDPSVLGKINSFLTTSIFLNPIAHLPNLTANWLAEKGLGILNPLQFGTELRAGVKSFNAVAHQNADFLDALDVGAPMHSQRLLVQQFSDKLVKILQAQATNPGVLTKLQNALGAAVNIPHVMQTIVDGLSSKITWPVHDMYILQSANAKMEARGMTLKQALDDTANYIPNERLPTRVFNSKALADMLNSPALMFTHYHYGVLKAWGQILKNATDTGFDAVSTNAQGKPVNAAGRTVGSERGRALSIAAGLAVMSAVVYPAIDKLLQEATGKKDARFRRAGLSTVADNVTRVAKGDISPQQAARSVVTPGVLPETVADLALNRDLLGTQRKIYDPHGSGKEIAQEVGTRVLDAVSPAQTFLQASQSKESAKRKLLELAGVTFPQHGAMRLAAELRADHYGDEAETPAERHKAILGSQARNLAWQGDLSGLAQAKKSGLFSPKEMAGLYMASHQDPLLYEAGGLGIKDLLKLATFRGTTDQERQKLRPLILRKAGGIQKVPADQRDGLRKQMHDAIAAH
jgi:hypothetical protein